LFLRVQVRGNKFLRALNYKDFLIFLTSGLTGQLTCQKEIGFGFSPGTLLEIEGAMGKRKSGKN
jgi:hypothetical protein